MQASDQSTKLKDNFTKEAWKAWGIGEWRKVLVWMKHGTIDSDETAHMVLEAAFKSWLQVARESDQKKREKDIESILEAYTNVLALTSITVAPMDFIKLSNIYICEGALMPALQILQLASVRGYLENTLVVLQSWTLLLHFEELKEAENSIRFLSSAITIEPRQAQTKNTDPIYIKGSDLRLVYPYLHCANYILNQYKLPKNARKRPELLDNLKALLEEAYFLHTSKPPPRFNQLLEWFNDDEMWMDMGTSLLPTQFGILLAEESYWQAFLRNPLANEALENIVKSMRTFKRKDCVRRLLTKALGVKRWNTFVRDELCHLDALEAIPYDKSWKKIFFEEERIISRIQGLGKAVYLRNHWIENMKLLIQKKDEFMSAAETCHRMYMARRFVILRKIVTTWREWSIESAETHYRCARSIQTCWRRKWAMLCYAWSVYKVQRANYNFLTVSQLNFDSRRLMVLRHWQIVKTISLRHRSADVIVSSVRTNGFARILTEAMGIILKVVQLRRRYSNPIFFTIWKKAMAYRKRKHARVTIRFFIRAVFQRKIDEQIELEMKAMETFIAKSFKLSPLPRYRAAWAIWRQELYKIRVQKAKSFVAEKLPHLLRRKRAAEVLKWKRLRKEAQNAASIKFYFRRRYRLLIFMRQTGAARKMQRFVRCRLAVKKVYRRLCTIRGVNRMISNRQNLKKSRSMFLWKKLIHLTKRRRLWARMRIILFFKHLRTRRLLRVRFRQKMRSFAIVDVLCRQFLRRKFTVLAQGTTLKHRYDVLLPFFLTVRRETMRRGMAAWARFVREQRVIIAIGVQRVDSRLSHRFWTGASESVSIRLEDEEIAGRSPTRAAAATASGGNRLLDDGRLGSTASGAPRVSRAASGAASQDFSCSDDVGDGDSIRSMASPVGITLDDYMISVTNGVTSADLSRPTSRPVTRDAAGVWEWEMPVSRSFRLLDAAQVLVCGKAFKCWMAVFREKNLLKRTSSSGFAAMLVTQYINRYIHITRCGIQIQTAARCSMAKKRMRRRRLQEEFASELGCKTLSNFKYLTLSTMMGSASQRRQSRLLLQCAWRQAVARRRVIKQRSYLARLSRAAHIVSSSGHQKWFTRKAFDGILFAFCSVALCTIRERHRDGLALHKIPGLVFSKGGGSKKRVGKVQQQVNLAAELNNAALERARRRPVTKLAIDPMDPSKIAKTTQGMTPTEMREKLSASQHKVAKYPIPDVTVARSKHKPLARLDFQSNEFHVNLYRLRQTGVFVFEPIGESLSSAEIIFFIKNAQTLFCQWACTTSLREISNHFDGQKIIFCDGLLCEYDIRSLLNFISRRDVRMAIHFFDTRLEFRGVLVLASYLSAVEQLGGIAATGEVVAAGVDELRAEKCNADDEEDGSARAGVIGSSQTAVLLMELPNIRELCVDTESAGELGVSILLASLQHNTTLEVFAIENRRGGAWPACLGNCLRSSALGNGSLQELRLFGTPLSAVALRGLLAAVRNGFSGLRRLEFALTADKSRTEELGLADKIIREAKRRMGRGQGSGLSVSVVQDA